MASAYNARALTPEVLVNGAEWAVVQERIAIEAMLATQRLPPWIAAGEVTTEAAQARAGASG